MLATGPLLKKTLALRGLKLLDYPVERWPTIYRLGFKEQCDALFEAIVTEGGVTKAAAALNMSRPQIYRFSADNKDFAERFLQARAIAAEALYDECIEIADSARDPRDKHVRIETRMRVAGKLIPRLSDKPLAQINVDNRTVVITEEKRAQLQDKLQKLQLRNRNDDDERPNS